MNKMDISGNRYGKLLVTCRVENKKGVAFWHCVCECGKTKNIAGPSLKRGLSNSCGCGQFRGRGHEIGAHRLSEYKTWGAMHLRCTNPGDKRYHRYGGRGIVVSEEWSDFDRFYQDMGARPKDLQLDRINNDGNYEPGNCRWISLAENIRNSACAKLDKTKVLSIRKLLTAGRTHAEIAAMFDVLPCSISKIKLGITWSNIK